MGLAEELDAVKLQLRKAKIELTEKLDNLNATIVNLQGALEATGGVDVNVVAALKEVKAAAQEIDDLVPDVEDKPLEAVGVDEDDTPLPDEVPEELPAEVTDEEPPAEVLEPVAEDVPAEPLSEETSTE